MQRLDAALNPQPETLAERQRFFAQAAARSAEFWSAYVRQHRRNLRALDAERDNVLQAIAAAQFSETIWQAAADLALAFHPHMVYAGLWRSWEQCLAHLLEAKGSEGQALTASLLYRALAEVQIRQGRPAEAVHRVEQAVDLLEKLGDSHQLTRGLRDLANSYFSLGRWDETEALAQKVQAAARPEDKDGVLADAFILRGRVALERKRTDQAIRYFESALQVADQPRVKSAANFLGLAYLRGNQPGAALPHFQQALDIARAESDRPGRGVIRSNMAKVYLQSEQPDQALPHLEASLALTRETDNRQMEAVILLRLGEAHRALGQHGLALRWFEQSLAMARELGLSSLEIDIQQAIESARTRVRRHNTFP